MNLSFEKMSPDHRKEIMDIFNYYVVNSFSAFADELLPYEYYDKLQEMTAGYPAFSIFVDKKIVGFCFLRPYRTYRTFNETAEITYFLDKGFRGKGIGKQALIRLENEARGKGIKCILACIASKNKESLAFHIKNGFRECGRFEKIIKKKDKRFDIIWMQKNLKIKLQKRSKFGDLNKNRNYEIH